MVATASTAADDQTVVIMPQLDVIQAKIKVFSPKAVLAAKEIYSA